MNKPIDVAKLLDQSFEKYNQLEFIKKDPISIPHQFNNPLDIEISGFFAAILAWGQRPTIIAKCNELMARMDNAPAEFVTQHEDQDLPKLEKFVHRTFNDTDLLHFVSVLKDFYSKQSSLEYFFINSTGSPIETGLNNLHHFFFNRENAPSRSKKHLAAPFKKSACKRLNMYLRWMVRKDEKGVDFGIWENVSSADLICPIDLHVERVARELGLLSTTTKGWKAAVELTENLKAFDPNDPIKYDIALFALGIDRVY